MHQPSWKYVEQSGPDKAEKTVADVYDAQYGHYHDPVEEQRAARKAKPAHETKRPFSIQGGK